MNKNLKKAISAIAALALTTTSLVAVTASYPDVTAETPYNSAINQLSAMGIIEGFEDGTFKPDEAVTRAQFAKLVAGTQNKLAQAEANSTVIFNDVPAGHWAVGYVAQAKQDGLVDGTNDEGTTFDPDNNVTYAQAMKMLVCAAGYENWSENAGGWPNGYLQYAGNAGIGNGITGVSNDTALTRGQCAQMIANTLVAPLCKITGYESDNGEQVAIRKQMDGQNGNYFESLLTNNWDMYEVNGTVTGTHESGATEAGELNYKIMKTKNFDDSDVVLSLSEAANMQDGGYVLTGVYEDDAKVASSTLNQYTRAIISIDESDETKKIVFIESAGKNVEQEFDANNYSALENVGTDTAKIKIFKSATSSTETEYKLSKNAKMLVNGVEIDLNDGNATKYLENNADVKAVLVDSPAMSNGSTDGKYDYVVVEYAATAVVDEVITKSDSIKIVFENYDTVLGKANLEIDLNDDDKVYTFVKDDAEIEATALVQNDVLSIVFDPKVADVNASKFIKAAVVNEVVTGQCTATGTDTDGETYYVVGGTNYYLSPACSDTLEMSYEYTLYLDINGEIAKVEQNAASVNYAIVDRFYTSAGDQMVRLITKTGEKSAYVLKEDQVGLFGTGAGYMENNKSYKDSEFAIEDRIVAYSINGSGEATLKKVTDVNNASINREGPTAFKASTTKIGSYKLTEGTIILNATAYADDATDAVTVIGLDYFIDEMDYVIVAAGKKNTSDSSYPFVVVVEGNDGYTVDTQMAVYESYGSTQVDGENKDQMYVYVNGENAEDSKGRTVVLAEDGIVAKAGLVEGDAIVYKKNSDGYVDEIVKVTEDSTYAIATNAREALAKAVTAKKDANSDMINDAVTKINFKGDGDVTFVFGPVISKTSAGVEIASVAWNGTAYVSPESGFDYSYDVDTKFYSFDGNGRTGNFIEVGSAGSVLKSSIVKAGKVDNETKINWNYADNTVNYVVARLLDEDVQEILAIYPSDKAGSTSTAPSATAAPATATPEATEDPAVTEEPPTTEAPATTTPDVSASGEVANEL